MLIVIVSQLLIAVALSVILRFSSGAEISFMEERRILVLDGGLESWDSGLREWNAFRSEAVFCFQNFLKCEKTFLPLKKFKIKKCITVDRVFSSLISVFTFLNPVSFVHPSHIFRLLLALTPLPSQLLQVSLYSSYILFLLYFCFLIFYFVFYPILFS